MKAIGVSMLVLAAVLLAWGAVPAEAWAGGGCAKAKADSAQAGCGCDQSKDCGCKQGKCDCAGKQAAAAPAPKAFDQPPAVGVKATCPVMGGEFTVAADTPRSEYQGKHYAFCCAGCKPKFDKDPGKFAVR